mmetsp:Transcript_57/g.42  ORF Transcript_57/g.42 Transcript_57/m.42 type:complete len:296 (-) Transcript_57:754-1641(-)
MKLNSALLSLLLIVSAISFLLAMGEAQSEDKAQLVPNYVKELDFVSFSPQPTYDRVIVILHGLGDDRSSFLPVMEKLHKKFPPVKFILPNAPMRALTVNNGKEMRAWYDLSGKGKLEDETCDGIEESDQRLREILEMEHAAGVPYQNMALIGFSQGGALSLFTGMQLDNDKALAGIVAWSGYLPCVEKIEGNENAGETPILHIHGEEDKKIKVSVAEDAKEKAYDLGFVGYDLEIIPGLEHSLNNQVMEKTYSFISKIFAREGTCSDDELEDEAEEDEEEEDEIELDAPTVANTR